MAEFNYSLDRADYTWKNALLWGNCWGHCKKVTKGSLCSRVVHALIAFVELIPILGQIASIFEMIIVTKCSRRSADSVPALVPVQLQREQKLLEQDLKERKPKSESFEEFRKKLRSKEYIEYQQKRKEYCTHKYRPVEVMHGIQGPFEERNEPLVLDTYERPKGIDSITTGATCFVYSAETISNYRGASSWRAIQTCLSTYDIQVSLDNLFHMFGPLENLITLYQNKYPERNAEEELSSSRFAPYDLVTGWAELFIGEMAMHFYGISADLELINGYPERYAPDEVCHRAPLVFQAFKERLKKHFEGARAAPIMIYEGMFTLNIVGIGFDATAKTTTLWISDPQIAPGVNQKGNIRKHIGLYTITLDELGNQIRCSLDHEDRDTVYFMYSNTAYKGLHFDTKPWMVLFPQPREMRLGDGMDLLGSGLGRHI